MPIDQRVLAIFAKWARIALVFALGAGVVLLWSWAQKSPDTHLSVADQWLQTVGNYGIEPVYPPQEDVLVGDVYAVIAGDKAGDVRKVAPLSKSIKLYHIDMTKEIEATYGASYQFPATAARPKEATDIWSESVSDGSVFAPVATRRALPLALLPDFTIEADRKVAVDNGLMNRLSLALSANNEAKLTMHVDGVETYGVNAIDAEVELANFCADPSYKPLCTDSGIRRQLSIITGDDIFMKVKEGAAETYRYEVNLALVSRVYLVRGIETDNSQDLEVGGKANAAAPAPGGSNAGADVAANDKTGFDTGLKPQTFERPIVIGMRTIRFWRKADGTDAK